MAKIGAHVSAAGSIDLAFDRAEAIGAECFQIFISPPQMWVHSKHDEDEVKRFLEKKESSGIGPNFIHGAYLINLATTSEVNLQKAVDWLVFSLEKAAQLQIAGTIFHLGSHKGVGFDKYEEQIIKAIKDVLNKTPRTSSLFLENSAGAGGCVGATFNELGRLIKGVGDERVKVCLDTQHAFAMGYDVKSLLGLKDMLVELEEEIGLNNLAVIHLNDSKTEYRSTRDRHENIGEGFIGREAFENIVNNERLRDIPLVLEVPGFAGNGPDKENVDLVKSLIIRDSSVV